MDAIDIILAVLFVVVTLSAIIYHIYKYIKTKKANKEETTQIVKFENEEMNLTEETSFKFEKVAKKDENKARKQFQISGSIRLAAGLGFDYDSFVDAKKEEFSHSIIGEELGIN